MQHGPGDQDQRRREGADLLRPAVHWAAGALRGAAALPRVCQQIHGGHPPGPDLQPAGGQRDGGGCVSSLAGPFPSLRPWRPEQGWGSAWPQKGSLSAPCSQSPGSKAGAGAAAVPPRPCRYVPSQLLAALRNPGDWKQEHWQCRRLRRVEGLEMGGGGDWGGNAGQVAGARPPPPRVRRRQRRGLPGLVMLLTPAAGGMFCCRNSSAALFLPRL